MFLQVSVCPQGGRGHVCLPVGVCVVAGGVCVCCWEAYVVAGGHAWLPGVCMVAGGHVWLWQAVHGCRGACMVAEGCVVAGGMHGCWGHVLLLGVACMVVGGRAWLWGVCMVAGGHA